MPANIEIKAKVEDMAKLEALAQKISNTPCKALQQEDIFFNAQNGRLKLRIFPDSAGELIYYHRPDATDAKQSYYQIYRSDKPDELKIVLNNALGSKIVVRKTRHLYISGQTRIHLDWVEGLGTFMELEVILKVDVRVRARGYREIDRSLPVIVGQKVQHH